ncbi:MAG: hypothetical protein A3J67_05400 [Parcubacteria group bacterium RIFCSPHIGHO2_02_FULL_48_10b]|nr:MAG: hypothetical protein A3J67_05400 [Parcubacteria group bacterium RIFCSPHIGHO2_02_FULL_48_10b]
MSTFFEKLTGSSPKIVDPDEAVAVPERKSDAKRVVRRSVPKREELKSMHLRVETEEQPAVRVEQTLPEEEGELTIDIYDKGDDIMIQSTVAGVKPEDLDVAITNDTVTIRGKRDRQEEIAEDNYYYKELFWGSFSRSVILPEEIDEDAAEASLKHGLLTVRLPKKKKGVVQKLKVKVT